MVMMAAFVVVVVMVWVVGVGVVELNTHERWNSMRMRGGRIKDQSRIKELDIITITLQQAKSIGDVRDDVMSLPSSFCVSVCSGLLESPQNHLAHGGVFRLENMYTLVCEKRGQPTTLVIGRTTHTKKLLLF